jgi:hypothetical protein
MTDVVGQPLIGHGAHFTVDGTTVRGCLSGDFGSEKTDTPETTNFGSAGTTRSYIGGLKNPGDFTAKFNVLPTDTSQLALDAANDTGVHTFTFVQPGSIVTSTFSGIISGRTESTTDDKLVTATYKIQITGDVVKS